MNEPIARQAARTTIRFVLLDAALWFVWLVGMLVAVSYVERTFRSFSLKVPAFTEAVLYVGRWLDAYWYVVAPPALLLWLALDGTVGYLLRSREGTRRLGNAWSIVMFGLPLLAILCSFLSLWLPLLRLQEGLSR
jgi:type II secretory pathway component PulF